MDKINIQNYFKNLEALNMAFEKLEKKVNQISKKIKQGRLSQEIGDEISNVIKDIEDIGEEAK